MDDSIHRIYLVSDKAESRGPLSRERVLSMIGDGQIQRSDLAWEAGMTRWDSVDNILFKNCRGIDRLAYLGLMIALAAYFVIMFVILDGVKINPIRMVDVIANGGTPKLYKLVAFLGVNAFGWVLAGLFLLPRLSHLGMRRSWAIVGAFRVIGWPLRLLGLPAPQGYAKTPGTFDTQSAPFGQPSEYPAEPVEDKAAERPPSPPPAGGGRSIPRKVLCSASQTSVDKMSNSGGEIR